MSRIDEVMNELRREIDLLKDRERDLWDRESLAMRQRNAAETRIAKVRDLCVHPPADLLAEMFDKIDTADPEEGWHATAMAAAQPLLAAIGALLRTDEETT